MSFTSAIKSELCRLESMGSCCRKAELAALIITNGNMQLAGKQRIQLNIVTEHAYIARRLYKLLKQEFDIVPMIMARKKLRLKKNVSYLIQIADSQRAQWVVRQLGIIDDQNQTGPASEQLTRKKCCRRAYLRGCFLAGGSISNPETSGYHLEIATEYSLHAENIKRRLNKMGIKCGIVLRKNQHVIYIKDSDQIASLLTTIGSSIGRLDFENARVYKEMRNRVNRLVNCETANVNKTVDAAQRQVAAIRHLELTRGLEKLNPGLRQIARLRLDNPEATLDELGQFANPPLSKSAVNYRLRKLIQLAQGNKRPDSKQKL